MAKNVKIPANYQTVMPYLILQGAGQFLEFLKNVFDAVETHKVMRDEHTIMHAEVMIGECSIMFAESTAQFGSSPAGLFVYVDDADRTYIKALEAGATSVTPVADQPYGRSGGVRDPFGNTWWITSVR